MPRASRPADPSRGPGRPAGARGGETRDALLRAAHEVMATKGYPRVTVREVAERAGVKPALVNYYFGGKEGLLRSLVLRVADQMRAPMERALFEGLGTETSLRELVRGIVQAIRTAPYGPRLMIEQVLFADDAVVDDYVEKVGRPTFEKIRSAIAEGEASGALRPVDPRFLVPALFGACVFFFLGAPVHRRIFGIDTMDEAVVNEFAEFTAELLLHGIAARGESR